METQEIPQNETTKLREADKTASIPMYILGGIVVVGFFTLLGTLLVHTVPNENIGPANQLFGSLSMAFGTVIGFFFGSSVGSKRNGEVLAEIAAKKTP